MTKNTDAGRIPDFSTRAEEAAWFDAHDIGDFIEDFKIVDRGDVVVRLLKEDGKVRAEPEDKLAE